MALAAAPVASAALTGSTITSSSLTAPWSLISGPSSDANAAVSVKLAGTYATDGKSADSVDIGCYRGTATPVADGVATTVTGGTYAVQGDAGLLGALCDLRVVPAAGAPAPTAASPYSAVRHGFVTATTSTPGAKTGGANATLATTSLAVVPQPGETVQSVVGSTDGRDGIYAALVGGDLTPGGSALVGVAALPTDSGGTAVPTAPSSLPERSGIQVGGVNALTPAQVEAAFAAGTAAQQANQPAITSGLTLSASVDGATGNTVVTTRQPLVTCADPTLPVTAAKCQTINGTGVTFQRVVTTSAQGRSVRVTDTFTATAARTLSLRYLQGFANTGTTTTAGPRFGADEGYLAGTDGESLDAGSAPGTIVVRTSSADPSLAHPEASLTYSTRPATTQVLGNGAAARLATTYSESVGAGAPATLTQTYVAADTDAAVQDLSLAARTGPGVAPGLTVTPLAEQVGTRLQTLFGVFSTGENGLPRTVTGLGTSAAVNQTTGAFALPIVLAPGLNTISVGGIDSGGGTATATVATTLVNPVAFAKPGGVVTTTTARHRVTVVSHGKRVTKTVPYKRFSGVAVRVPVSCAPVAGANGCLVRIAVASGRSTLANSTVRVKVGLSAVLVRLTPAASRAYLAHRYPPPKHVRRKGRVVAVPVKPTAYVVTVRLAEVDGDGSTLFPSTTTSARFS